VHLTRLLIMNFVQPAVTTTLLRPATFWPWNSTVLTDLEHLYRIYSIPTHDKHQWLLLQFIVLLMIDVKGVRNM